MLSLRRRKQQMFENLKKYGVPLYGAAWVPHKQIRSKFKSQRNEQDPNDETSADKSEEFASPYGYVVLCGGGGESRSGIPNNLLVASYDFASNSLSDHPVAKLGTGSDLPYRMAVHPGGDGLICAMPQSCRLYEWDEVKSTQGHNLGEWDEVKSTQHHNLGKGDEVKSTQGHNLGLKASKKVLTELEGVGQQLALVFNSDGSVLAVGGENGDLRVFRWPSMEIILNKAKAHPSVKDISFSPDGKYLVSLGDSGPGRVWDVTSSTVVASLPEENGEKFASCRFSQINDTSQVLYIAAVTGRGASIVTWNTTTWKRMHSKQVVRDPVCSFNVSTDGRLLAIGTTQGDILIINSTNMRVQTMIRKAHIVVVTALMFSDDSRALVSASMDASARVTLIEDEKKKGGSSLWVIVLIILLAIAVYYMKNKGFFP